MVLLLRPHTSSSEQHSGHSTFSFMYYVMVMQTILLLPKQGHVKFSHKLDALFK